MNSVNHDTGTRTRTGQPAGTRSHTRTLTTIWQREENEVRLYRWVNELQLVMMSEISWSLIAGVKRPRPLHTHTHNTTIHGTRRIPWIYEPWQPLLNQRQRQKRLTWAVEKNNSVVQSPLFSWKQILHFIWKSRSQSLEEEWRGTESMLLEVQCEVSTVSDDLGCHFICWCWSTVFSEVHSQCSHLPGNFRALHASFCWQALWRCWFHFPAGLGTCPHCQRYQKLVQWPWCWCAWLASKLAWPEPHRESMGYCQEEDERHQTQQCRWAEGHCQRNLGFHTTSAVPQTDHLHATPNWGSN